MKCISVFYFESLWGHRVIASVSTVEETFLQAGSALLLSMLQTCSRSCGTLCQETTPPRKQPTFLSCAQAAGSSLFRLWTDYLRALRGIITGGGPRRDGAVPLKVVSTRERCPTAAAGRAAPPALPPRWETGTTRLGGHGLRLEEAGRPGGQQPREDLLHPEENTSGNQNGHSVRVRAAGLQSGRWLMLCSGFSLLPITLLFID